VKWTLDLAVPSTQPRVAELSSRAHRAEEGDLLASLVVAFDKMPLPSSCFGV
jgi:hypothetical protein